MAKCDLVSNKEKERDAEIMDENIIKGPTTSEDERKEVVALQESLGNYNAVGGGGPPAVSSSRYYLDD